MSTVENSMNLNLTNKQRKFWHEADRMYNFKIGGTGSGKTYMDYYLIPKRLKETRNKGDIVIFGNTKGTIQRNIIGNMQKIWGKSLVSNVSSNNTCRMFGKTVHILGADNKGQVERVRGMTIEYAYGDELATWNREVFEVLKSRLRVAGAKLDGTANPKEPTHWLKKFVDDQESTGLLYNQHYILDDGLLDPDDPVNDRRLKDNIKNSYEKDSVFYKRDILGLWVREDGLIHPSLSQNVKNMIVSDKEVPNLHEVMIGIDFGGNKSKHAMVATGFANNYKDVYVLASRRIEPTTTSEAELAETFVNFLREIEYRYKVPVYRSYADSAEQNWIRTFMISLSNNGLSRQVHNSQKGRVINRIRMTSSLISQKRLRFVDGDTESLQDALLEASWDASKLTQERLDDGSTDVDSLDAFEYSFSSRMEYLIRAGSLGV